MTLDYVRTRPVRGALDVSAIRTTRPQRQLFNRNAGRWWSELHRAAKVKADRATGFTGKLAARVWEKQQRGVAHLHGVISVGTPVERVWAEAYVRALTEMSPRYGFGFR